MVSGPGITLEEINRIKSTIGSLYTVTEESVVLSEEDNTQAEFLFVGSIVFLLDYYPKPSGWASGVYDYDAWAKVLTPSGFIGTIWFASIKQET
jgi:hypothetical protein